jgi:exonuclease VII large subunit
MRLESVNPDNVLSRGYSYVESADGNAIDSVSKVAAGQEVNIVFADGTAKSTIIDTSRKEV